jgi:hypothetical protein
MLSVQKVVLTLTSKSAEIYLSMAGAKKHNDTGFSWFRPWAVRPAGVCSGRCIVLHRSACRGELQARRERRRRLQVPEVWLRRSANIVVKAETCKWAAIRPSPQRGQRTASSFYRPRGGGLQSCRTVLRLHMAAWRTMPWSWWLSWRISLPSGVVASPVPAQERLRGWLCGSFPFWSPSVR